MGRHEGVSEQIKIHLNLSIIVTLVCVEMYKILIL